MTERYFSVNEAARITGRSTRSVYRDLYSGYLPARRVKRSWRIAESDLGKYLKTLDETDRFGRFLTATRDIRSSLDAEQRMKAIQVISGLE